MDSTIFRVYNSLNKSIKHTNERRQKMYYEINHEIAMDMLEAMPEEKKKVLRKALERNWILVGSYMMDSGNIVIYKEGFYLKLEGSRCSFNVFAFDRDGKFEFARKPHESKLNKIYEDGLKLCESDFRKF